MSVQFIEQNGQRQYAVLPISDYASLLEKAEMLDDIHDYDEALVQDEEMIPASIVYRLMSENKTKVWREYRGMTQTELAEHCELAQATIAQIEGGKRTGSVEVLKKIAAALVIDLDDLV
ncbi:MAG: hypothetical protein RLZ92_1416 [Pseudomonadota bacterium]|jgi:DNA-binding XRE family transcriptional regulator